MSELLSWLKTNLGYTIADIAVWKLGLSFLILVASLFARKLVSRVVSVHLKKLAARTRWEFDDMLITALETPVSWGVVLLGIYLALLPLDIAEKYDARVAKLFGAADAVLVMVFFLKLIDGLAEYLKPRFAKTETSLDDALVPAMKAASKILVIMVSVIWVLNYFNYPIASILAGLGVGGLAVALAAQGTLSNWFGAFMIFTDRPFCAGDRIAIDKYDGFVEQVGLRSTRLRTLEGTLVTIPNATVANSQIDNISRMPARRSNFTVGVCYDATAEKMEEAVAILKDILRQDSGIRDDFTVAFEAFGDFSLNIRVIFWCTTADYAQWLATVERVNFAIMRRFNAAGIEMAFPTQTLYLKQAAPAIPPAAYSASDLASAASAGRTLPQA